MQGGKREKENSRNELFDGTNSTLDETNMHMDGTINYHKFIVLLSMVTMIRI